MNIRHHLDEATLFSYTAGSLTNAMATVVATHLSLCAECRARAANLETLGGVMLESLQPESCSEDLLDNLLGAIDVDEPQIDIGEKNVARDRDAEVEEKPVADVPYPLSEMLPAPLEQLEWKRMAPGVHYYDLPAVGSGACRLLQLAPGRSVLPHSHNGNELTLILRGSYTDDLGRFAAGDIADLDDEVSHQPLVDSDEPCICLVATDAPLKFQTLLGRLIQPMTGF